LPGLAAAGVNTVIVEVDYSFEFKSHPELSSPDGITQAHAHEFTAEAHQLGIRVIPEFNCLGHQSWGKTTFALLTKYPEFDETPGQSPDNKGIYCRSWCPKNPAVNKIVFTLIDELADAFEADAFHVGMDEVLIIADENCPRCKGGAPARLFAKAVNDLHAHLVGQRKLEMFMWADRLLDDKTMHYGAKSSAANGTAGAVDLIPKDIVQCDWHYEIQAGYPSVPFLLGKGFRVWPCGWRSLGAVKAFSNFSKQQKSDRVAGYLCTTWDAVKIPDAAAWPPLTELMREWK